MFKVSQDKWDRAQEAHDQREAERIVRLLHAATYTDVSVAEAVVNLSYYRGILAGIQWSDQNDTPHRQKKERIKQVMENLERMQRDQANRMYADMQRMHAERTKTST